MSVTAKYERGAGKVIAIILILILLVVGYACVQLLPLYWDHATFEETVKSSMVSTLVPPYKDVEATVTQKIVASLDDMEAQYEKEHIKVEVGEKHKNIHVEVWYSRSHHLPLYANPKQFYISLDHKPILPKSLDLPKRTPVPGVDL